LQKYLSAKGFDVSIIDYRCPNIENQYRLFSLSHFTRLKSIKSKIRYLLSHINSVLLLHGRKKAFNLFLKEYMCLSVPCFDSNARILSTFDVVITGSDQVWNTNLTGGMDKLYFLDIALDGKIRKIAYAASAEISALSELSITKDELQRCLLGFDLISVRENHLAKLIAQILDREPEVTIDPTLLLNKSVYERLIPQKQIEKRKYILVYTVVNDKNVNRIANKIAKEKNLKIVKITSKLPIFDFVSNFKKAIGPMEFLQLIQSAEFVITTSFHGTIFSILFEKQFLTIKAGSANRQLSLLKSLNLESQFLKDEEEFIQLKDIDYKGVSERLCDMRLSSIDFLERISNYEEK